MMFMLQQASRTVPVTITRATFRTSLSDSLSESMSFLAGGPHVNSLASAAVALVRRNSEGPSSMYRMTARATASRSPRGMQLKPKVSRMQLRASSRPLASSGVSGCIHSGSTSDRPPSNSPRQVASLHFWSNTVPEICPSKVATCSRFPAPKSRRHFMIVSPASGVTSTWVED